MHSRADTPIIGRFVRWRAVMRWVGATAGT